MATVRKAHEAGKTYGCDDCSYLKGKRCRLWEVKVNEPEDSCCESHTMQEEGCTQRELKW